MFEYSGVQHGTMIVSGGTVVAVVYLTPPQEPFPETIVLDDSEVRIRRANMRFEEGKVSPLFLCSCCLSFPATSVHTNTTLHEKYIK